MKIFFSHAVGTWDGPIAARLRAVAAVYDIAIMLPDRVRVVHNGLFAETKAKIKQADALISLVTRSASFESIRLVNLELECAMQIGKPAMALVESGFQFESPENSQVVYFDRSDPTAHEPHLVKALQNLKAQQSSQDLTALGWISNIVLGLVALTDFLTDENEISASQSSRSANRRY